MITKDELQEIVAEKIEKIKTKNKNAPNN